MRSDRYTAALSRTDLSQWLVHFVRSVSQLSATEFLGPEDALHRILSEGRVRASTAPQITRYEPRGAACFFDVPPAVWPDIVKTNPADRQGFGLIVSRQGFWSAGGRPAIYTDIGEPTYWPEAERYRVIYTNLARTPDPIDWTHEREWRVRGDLHFNSVTIPGPWWWPVVPTAAFLPRIWSTLPGVQIVYVLDQGRVVERASV